MPRIDVQHFKKMSSFNAFKTSDFCENVAVSNVNFVHKCNMKNQQEYSKEKKEISLLQYIENITNKLRFKNKKMRKIGPKFDTCLYFVVFQNSF